MPNIAYFSFSIDPYLLKQLIKLNDLISDQYNFLQTLPKDDLDHIHHYAFISMVGASTRIENAILTDSEIDWLDSILTQDGKTTSLNANIEQITNKLSKDKERSIEEVAGRRTILLLIYEQSKDYLPFSEFLLRSLHSELLRHDKRIGLVKGKYKENQNSVVEFNHLTGKTKTIFKTADPGIETSMAMKELIEWYNSAIIDEALPLVVACEFVFRFLAIHPFQDGNGRLGRALLIMSLLHCNNQKLQYVMRLLAIDRNIEKHKEEYYIILNQCSKGKFNVDPKKYHIQYFVKYMVKIMEEALSDVQFYAERSRRYKLLSPSALQVYSCFKGQAEIRFKTGEIEKITKLPRRTITASLSTLVKYEFIARFGQGAGSYYQLVF